MLFLIMGNLCWLCRWCLEPAPPIRCPWIPKFRTRSIAPVLWRCTWRWPAGVQSVSASVWNAVLEMRWGGRRLRHARSACQRTRSQPVIGKNTNYCTPFWIFNEGISLTYSTTNPLRSCEKEYTKNQWGRREIRIFWISRLPHWHFVYSFSQDLSGFVVEYVKLIPSLVTEKNDYHF